jgi:hypothetical protein
MFFQAVIWLFCIAVAVQLAQAQNAETNLLGGPCADPKTRRDEQLISQRQQDLKRNDPKAVLAPPNRFFVKTVPADTSGCNWPRLSSQ